MWCRYAPALVYEYKGVKVVSLAIVVGFAIYFSLSMYWASQLRTPEGEICAGACVPRSARAHVRVCCGCCVSAEEEWFESAHMFNGLRDFQGSTYYAAPVDS